MKVWPLLIAGLLPLYGYAAINDNENHDGDSNEGYEKADYGEFEGFYGNDDFVSISTGTKKSLAKAPSVASVITAKHIKQMGYRTLSEVLAVVPGLHVSFSSELYAPKFLVRGIVSPFNPQTLMLVNGTPISSVVRGDRHAVWGGFPLAAVARIEVIRGPGSALHGADAFAGVVNVITKEFADIDKTEVGIRGGSFSTKDIWAQSAFELGDLKVAFSAEWTDTDGQDELIGSDAQSNSDAIFAAAPNASLAPGSVNVGYEGYDIRADLSYENFGFKFAYQNRDDVGTGQGVAKALDPSGKFASDKLLINFNYINQLSDNWSVDARLSHYRTNQTIEDHLLLFPPGSFAGGFPEGFSGNPEWFETNDIAKGHFSYSGFSKRTITFGAGYREEDVYRVTQEKNFGPTGWVPEFISVTDTPGVFLPENARYSHFAFIQDEYQFAADWELTFGLRYDNYSDFGTTVNPRLAVVWATNRNLSTKFLYGRAFRAPSFGETIVVNNPVNLGNSNIEPETIDTFEIAFNYQFSQQIHIDMNLYHLRVGDLIDFVPDDGVQTATAQNSAQLKGYGVEFEINYKVSDTLGLLANYAYQDTEEQKTKDDVGGAPNHQYYGQMIWSVTDSISFNTEINYIGKQQRNHLDSRKATGAYTSVAFTLNYNDIFDGVNLQLKINNAFDETIREPSLGPTESDSTAALAIPGDLPQAGRAISLGLQKTF
jgi:outer membrane receptor for ferrienterochelin and colicin